MAKSKPVVNDQLSYKKPSFWQLVWQHRTLILMCTPAIIFFFVFSYMPMPGAYIAFTNFQYNKGIFNSPFIGLQNFKFLFMSGQLTLLLKNTVLYNIAFILLGNFLQLTFAILLNEVQSKWYKKVTQSMMFLPYFISDVLVALLVCLIPTTIGALLSAIGIAGMDRLGAGVFKTIHAGFDPAAACEDPNRIVPLDVMVEFLDQGVYGSLHPYFYSTVGTGTTEAEAARMAREWVPFLQEDHVDGVIMITT